jgi:L-lactate dehydrogenase
MGVLIMKIGIVGAGRVGCARSRQLFAGVPGTSSSWTASLKCAKAVATDLRYGSPLCPKTTVVDGHYDDLADAALVMVTAGINEKAGSATDRNDPEGRLRLLDRNAEIYRDIVPRVVRAAPRAVILVITDPPDPVPVANLIRLAVDRESGDAVCHEGSLQPFWLDGRRSDPPASSAEAEI